MKQPSKERGCEGKIKLLGDIAVIAKTAERLKTAYGKDYGAYRCPHCGGAHLTTKLENRNNYEPLLYVTQSEGSP